MVHEDTLYLPDLLMRLHAPDWAVVHNLTLELRHPERLAWHGNAHQLLNQAVGVIIAWGLAIVGTLVILKVVDAVIGLRVADEHEIQGLDLSQHGEEGYNLEA